MKKLESGRSMVEMLCKTATKINGDPDVTCIGSVTSFVFDMDN